jgi:cytochrome oxidase Cu insertion factor (SCO1/SenC/PrrC family)
MPAPELQADARRTRAGRIKMLLVLLVCAAPVLASYFSYFVLRPQARNNYSTLIQPSRGLPALTLHTLDGKPVEAASLRGQWLLLAVGPAGCDEACQQRLFLQRQLREMLGRERERVDKVWLVTDGADPAPALRAALAADPSMQVLRAPPQALAAWLQPEAGHALEDHLYLVDPMGEWMMRVPAGPDPARVKRDLERLLRAAASWDLPGR